MYFLTTQNSLTEHQKEPKGKIKETIDGTTLADKRKWGNKHFKSLSSWKWKQKEDKSRADRRKNIIFMELKSLRIQTTEKER